MNGYFAKTTDSNVIQTSISFEPPKQTFNTASPVLDFCRSWLPAKEAFYVRVDLRLEV
jgi:hypothetical protein